MLNIMPQYLEGAKLRDRNRLLSQDAFLVIITKSQIADVEM